MRRRWILPCDIAVPTPFPSLVAVVAMLVVASTLTACGGDDGHRSSTGHRRTLPGRPQSGATAPPTAPASAGGTPLTPSTSPSAPAPATIAPATTTPPISTGLPATPPVTTLNGGPQRDLPVASTHFVLIDNSRQTRTGAGAVVAPTRTLPTTVWYPTSPGGPWPLVVFGHGFRVGPAPYERLCRQWASAGYVVAAPSFPLSDVNVAGANLDESDISNEPGDMSFVVTRLLALTSQPTSADNPLSGRVDGQRVAAAGHSDGATASVYLGYAPGYRDPRLRAVIALSADPFPDRASVPGSIPMLSVHGDADSVVPFTNAERLIGQVQARRFFLVLHGADHLPPVEGASRWTPVVERVTMDFLDRYLADRTATDDFIVADADYPDLATLSLRQ